MDHSKMLGMSVGLAIVIALAVGAFSVLSDDDIEVEIGTVPTKNVNPMNYTGLMISTLSAAVSEANNVLDSMTAGNVSTLLTEIVSYEFIEDYTMGGEVYWQLDDGTINVCIDAYDGEILAYTRRGYNEGSISAGAAMDIAEDIVNQFDSLPIDSAEATVEHTQMLTHALWDPYEETTTYVNQSTWVIRYNRTFDSILCADHITVILDEDGSLSSYYKDWNMDLEGLSTTYQVSQNDAIDYALDELCPDNGYYVGIYKRIVRPSGFWTAEFNEIEYDADPLAVWVVWIHDEAEENLLIVYVNAHQLDIVGGDKVGGYYSGWTM